MTVKLLIVLSAVWCSCNAYYKKCSFAKPSEMCQTECSTSKCKRMAGICELAKCPDDRERFQWKDCIKSRKKGKMSICKTTDIRYDLPAVLAKTRDTPTFCDWTPGDDTSRCVAEHGADCTKYGRRPTEYEIEGYKICLPTDGCGEKGGQGACTTVDCSDTHDMIWRRDSVKLFTNKCCGVRLNSAGEPKAKCEDYKAGGKFMHMVDGAITYRIYKLKSTGLVCHQQTEENGE
eukprot:968405_1